MRPTTPLILGIAFGTVLFASPSVWADGNEQCSRQGIEHHAISHPGWHTHGGMGVHILRHLLKSRQALGLTDDQIAKLRTVALDADRARIRAEADVLISKRELRSLFRDEKAEMPSIEAKVKEQESLEAMARIIGIRAKRDLLGVLTPEQRAKQNGLWEQHRQHDPRHMMRAETGKEIDAANDLNANEDAFEIEMGELEDGLAAG